MQTVETLNEGLKRAYRITIPAKDIDARVDERAEDDRAAGAHARLPPRQGARPTSSARCTAPRSSSRRCNSAVQEGVQQLIAEQKIRPAMQPQVELEEGGPGKDAVVKVELETLPDVPEPKIDGLKIERLTVEPTDEEIDAAVARLAEGQKSFDPAPAEHKARRRATSSSSTIEGKVDGEPFEGGKGEGMSVELGSGRLIPGFEDQLVGAKANEQRTRQRHLPGRLSGRLSEGPRGDVRRHRQRGPDAARDRRPTTTSPSRWASRGSTSCASC